MIWRGRNDTEPGPEPEPRREPEGEAPPPPGDSVGRRIESILEAAERAAAGIREDAETWARRYAEESKQKADQAAAQRIQELSTLTDDLIQRARSVAQQSDALIGALDDAGRRMLNSALPGQGSERPREEAPPPAEPPPQRWGRTNAGAPQPGSGGWRPAGETAAPRGTPAQQPAPQAPPPSPPAPAEPEPAPRAPEARPTGQVSEGARVLATQMAVAGSTRDEIAWRLQDEFGIQDPSPILHEIGI